MRSIIVLTVLAFSHAAVSHAAPADKAAPQEELSKQSRIYESRGEDRPEGYVIGRSLLSYTGALPAEFITSLANLSPQERWLDVGAGEGRAILDYWTAKYDVLLKGPYQYGRKAKATAMSIEDRRTPQWYQTAAAAGADQIQYLAGRRLREYSLEELGRFKIITDVFGGFSYTRYPATYMEKALGLLEPNGTLYTVLQDVHWQEGSNKPFYAGSPFLTQIADGAGAEMKVCAWLKSISCVEVTCEGKDASPPVEMYRVRKVCENVNVPKLELVSYQAGTPPERGFRISTPTEVLR